MSLQIAPSVLSADFSRLGEQVETVLQAGADVIHIDVMDGHFVPQITIGPLVVEALRRVVDGRVPLDVHLMVHGAESQLQDFVNAGADWISIHAEAITHLHGTLQQLRSLGVKAGVTLNPSTPLSAVEEVLSEVDHILIMTVNPGFGGQKFIPEGLDKIRRLRTLLESAGRGDVLIEIDGGVKASNIASVAAAGANVVVAGSAVFGGADPAANLIALREAATG